FADSSAEAWTAGAILSILNWSGSTNGGGSDQLFFGTNASGLTLAQLAQIRFVNPAGFPPGTNFARILATGEVVPTVQPVLLATTQGTTTTLSWPAPFKLLSATNVLGPYVVVPGAVSPYVIDTTVGPMRFFRLVN
ncbi:MAG: lipolytic protein family, partial [Pedosphaera sp.]|nr:lipolytic protein family [Pedosphaera sp.]